MATNATPLAAGLLVIAASVCLSSLGCTNGGPLSRWRLTHDDAIAPPPKASELGDARGPLARLITPENAPAKVDREVRPVALAPPRKDDAELESEFQAAEKLLSDGRLAQAEQAFVQLDRKREHGSIPEFLRLIKKKDESSVAGQLRKSQPGWGERALYFLSEAQYRQGKLMQAHDTIDKLFTTYPGTRYVDKLVEREYEIANVWLDAVDPSAPKERREGLGDRLNGRLPLVDVSGHALQALEHVQHHDPSGPLADEAAMKVADYHFLHGNYEEAAAYYDQLIANYPKSKLLAQAYAQAIDAKVKAYVGPDYDGTALEKAKEQIYQMTKLFPDREVSTSETMSHTLDLIENQQAETTFRRGEFYRKTGYPGAAELCFGEVRARWPTSTWAKQSQSRLDQIARMPRPKVEPSKIMAPPGSGDPYASGISPGTAGNAFSPLSSPGGP